MQEFEGMAPQSEAGHVHSAQAGRDASYSSRRRITANSFKLLTARLKSKEPLPELFEPAPDAPPAPEPYENTRVIAKAAAPQSEYQPEPEHHTVASATAEPPQQPDVFESPPTGFSLPRFVPLNEQFTEPSPAAQAVLPELPEPAESPELDQTIGSEHKPQFAEHGGQNSAISEAPSAVQGDWPDFPAFGETLAVAPQHAEPAEFVEPQTPHVEPAIEALEISQEPQSFRDELPELTSPVDPEPALAEPTPALASEAPGGEHQIEAPAASPESELAPRAASPLAEKVVEALIKTVAEAVYAKPSASERAAFLREVAELIETDSEAVADTSQIAPEPVPPPSQPAPEVIEIAESQPLPVVEEATEITQVIADRLGPSSPILRKAKEQDPFALAKPNKQHGHGAEALQETDEDTGELALSLLDMMSGGSAASQPQERALAADTLLRLVPRIPPRQLLAISERVAIMEAPPSLLVAKLIRDSRHEVAAPLLERCMHITDQDLATATAEGDVHKLRMIARRRTISPTLSDQLIDRGDTSVILTLVRNPGAALNHDSYFRLAEHAIEHHSVLAPLATRADLPAPVAFELFWHVPHELRRFLLSRFLTDSENLNRILKITMATQAPADSASGAEPKFPAQEQMEAAIAHVAKGELETGAQILADAAGIAVDTVLRALADRDGEPLAVLLKTLGFQRSRFADAVASLQNASISLLNPNRKVEELQSVYDTLSFNKARILLTYWDWYTRKAGPYAPRN